MTTFNKIKLDADTQGVGIPIPADSIPVTIHSTQASSTVLDELWLYVSNASPIDPLLVQVYFTNAVFTTWIVEVQPASGMVLLVPGLIVSGNGTVPSTVAVADVTGSLSDNLSAYGYVNRITP